MRLLLKEREKTRESYSAIFERKDGNWRIFTNVRDNKNNFIAEHIWLKNEPQLSVLTNLHSGDRITFTALSQEYSKRYKIHGIGVKDYDYCLTDIQDVTLTQKNTVYVVIKQETLKQMKDKIEMLQRELNYEKIPFFLKLFKRKVYSNANIMAA